MITTATLARMRADRGPRYLVHGTIRTGQFRASYATDSAEAEALYQSYTGLHCYTVRVVPPDVPGVGIDLTRYRDEADAAERTLRSARQTLQAAVLCAALNGRHPAEIARSSGVEEDTVRQWIAALPPADTTPPAPPTDWWTATDKAGTEIARVHGETIERAAEAARTLDQVKTVERAEGGFSLRRLRADELTTAQLPTGPPAPQAITAGSDDEGTTACAPTTS